MQNKKETQGQAAACLVHSQAAACLVHNSSNQGESSYARPTVNLELNSVEVIGS